MILRNIPRENPGLFETVLNEYGIKYQIVDWVNEFTVVHPEKNGALVVLGGPDSANDNNPKIQSESAFIEEAIRANVPFLGICLGLQLFVKTLGGKVVRCKVAETGFRDRDGDFYKIKLTDAGKRDKLFCSLPEDLNVFQLHGETVEIIPGMAILATGKYCNNQAIRFGDKAYGIQAHFELTDSLLDSWIKEDSDLHKLDENQLRSDYKLLKPGYQNTGRIIINNFLSIAGYI